MSICSPACTSDACWPLLLSSMPISCSCILSSGFDSKYPSGKVLPPAAPPPPRRQLQHVVDAIGGYEICVDLPVRDSRSGLDLPAGCTVADGEQTLAWLRSRHTEELTANGWRTMSGVSDLARNERQREFVIEIMSRVSDFSSPQQLASTARALAPFVTVDADLGITDAVGLAWAMRGVGAGNVDELTIPVRSHTTNNGASVLVATEDVAGIVASFIDAHARTMSGSPAAG